MSLVHESLIETLNRRFVSTYWNAFPGPGFDDQADAFAKELQAAGGELRYGAILTPDGELVSSFGFGQLEVFRAFRRALAEHSELAPPSEEEAAILRRAELHPEDVDAQLAAAELLGHVLDFAGAHACLDRLEQTDLSAAMRARAAFLRGHLHVLDWEQGDPAAAREAFDSMPIVPEDLRDDVLLDRIALDVELDPSPGFYRGWRFREGSDLVAHRSALEALIAEVPQGDRIGQAHFFLGLTHAATGDFEAAEPIWRRHTDTWPEDRWAMLSRIHHRDYVFSPHKKTNQGTAIIQHADASNLDQVLEGLGAEGRPVRISINGEMLEGEEAEEMLRKLLGGEKPPKKDGKSAKRKRGDL